MSELSGHLSLRAAVRDHGRTVLATQSFRAPYHLSKPYWDADTRTLLVQVVNPTAGILAGDRLESQIAVDAGACLLVTTPSASRLFQMQGGAAECRQQFSVAAGGWLEVMPEALVPHRGSRYRQITTVDVAADGALFFVDQLLPGRIGHGETWAWDRLCLELTVRVAGELALRERWDQSGEELRALAELAGSGPTACFANAVLLGPNSVSASAAPWLAEISALHREGLWLGASVLRRGGWSIKLVATDALRLRDGLRDLRRILAVYFPRLACDPRKL
ncbi:urease accessory protein UreD [Horticoccus sp. 23ND18S-11]|uniref:urease accessory protein UreD n=1 Tax=Horticoccus sp. 23ND18S-11 TaxID=3391832 RepID=UPI0039C9D1B9